MKSMKKIGAAILGLALLASFPTRSAFAADPPKDPAAEIAKKEAEAAKREAEAVKRKADGIKAVEEATPKITAAAPEAAQAKPQKARKVLVYTKARGYVHDSIPVGAKAIEILGNKTGAFTTVISDDFNVFAADSLKDFDCVVMMSTTGDQFGAPKELNETLHKSLLDFVSGGKGLVGIHAASDTGKSWPEYNEMLGGLFREHPFHEIVAKNEDPKNPVNSAFKGEAFPFSDEIYIYQDEPYSRDKLHVLLSVDLEKSVKINPKDKDKRADHDYAVSWIKTYGQGRVFYTLYGHNRETYWNTQVLQHILDGVQFAIGDLKADATPSGKKAAGTANSTK